MEGTANLCELDYALQHKQSIRCLMHVVSHVHAVAPGSVFSSFLVLPYFTRSLSSFSVDPIHSPPSPRHSSLCIMLALLRPTEGEESKSERERRENARGNRSGQARLSRCRISESNRIERQGAGKDCLLEREGEEGMPS
eukprot:1946702-Pleurochrysis_carterae.AAC.1